MIERLSDSCILQLVKTCFSTLLVDNIQLLQLKAISLIGEVWNIYLCLLCIQALVFLMALIFCYQLSDILFLPPASSLCDG